MGGQRLFWIVAVVCVLGCGGVTLEGSSRIIDGIVEKNAAQWPSVVSLALEVGSNTLSSFCTGALIDDDIVITAAHCLVGLAPGRIIVCAGTVDINNGGTCVRAQSYQIPGAYDPAIVAQANDVAMLQLRSSLVGGSVQTVAMTFQVPIDNQVAFGVGYGVSEQGEDATTDGLLRFLDSTIPPNSECRTLVETTIAGSLNPAYLCADGNWDGSRGTTCNGDSGGPLYIVTGDDSTMYSVGVVSFGISTEEESCHSELETVYMSFAAAEHIAFINAAVDEFGGSYRTVDPFNIDSTTTCDEPAVEVCMSVLRAGCSSGDSSTQHAVDCVNELIGPCSGTALATEWETLSQECTAACMPAGEWVRLADGTSKRVEELEAGEHLDTGSGSSSDVFGFTHRMPDEVSVFERIEVGQRAVHLSAGHYIPVGGRLRRAADVEVGDRVSLADGTNAAVTGRSRVTMKGLYHPHTLNDVMVVDGIVISTFTDTVHPTVAKWLLAAPKALYRLGIKEPLGGMLYRTVPSWMASLVKGASQAATNLVGA